MGCPKKALIAGKMQEHFMYRQFFSKVAVLQEGCEPLHQCGMFEVHMTEGRLIKNRRTVRYFNNTEIRINWKAVEVISWCVNMEFTLTRKEGEETIERVSLFTYLGWPLNQSDDGWMKVRRRIGKTQQV